MEQKKDTTRVWQFSHTTATSSADAWKQGEEKLALPLQADQILIETVLVSCDPYLRIQQSRKKTWQAPTEEGTTQDSFAIGRVLESTSSSIAVGDFVRTYSGWRERAVLSADSVQKLPYKTGESKIALEHYLGALGMVGRTAVHGIEKVFTPIKQGETAFVTGGAGAVGLLVVQVLKKRGMYVVATAGSDEKCELLKSLGADVALNYKTTKIDHKNVDALRDAFNGKGIDCMFDNTGGDQFDAAIQLINEHARIAVCGQISQYDHLDGGATQPAFLFRLIYTRAKIEGILQRDATPEQDELHQRSFTEMLISGELKAPFTVEKGFENIPKAQEDMMKGTNIGKMLVALVSDY